MPVSYSTGRRSSERGNQNVITGRDFLVEVKRMRIENSTAEGQEKNNSNHTECRGCHFAFTACPRNAVYGWSSASSTPEMWLRSSSFRYVPNGFCNNFATCYPREESLSRYPPNYAGNGYNGLYYPCYKNLGQTPTLLTNGRSGCQVSRAKSGLWVGVLVLCTV